MYIMQSRRDFLASASSAAAAAASALGPQTSFADEGPPETTTVRLLEVKSAVCLAPTYIAQELLRAEGFTDVRLVRFEAGSTDAGMVADGHLDISQTYAVEAIRQIDLGRPVTVLAGVHPGCQVLFAREPVNGIKDLKGRSVAIRYEDGYSLQQFLAVFAAYIGLDTAKDVTWVSDPELDHVQAFLDGRVDALFGDPLDAQTLRARGFRRIVFSAATDRPWSQYFCCMLAANTDYVRKHPIATKRIMRAIFKAADICVAEPARAARMLVDGGHMERYDDSLQGMAEVPFGQWREYDPEDSLRYYALRMYEVGLIKTSPNELIAEGADWRVLNELKRELKA
jgi:NitT/TauT family transport system substrate-binding protein